MYMKRVQVYLRGEQLERLEELSETLGCSKASLIREGIDLMLIQRIEPAADPLWGLVGQAGPVGDARVGAEHDRVLADWELGE